MHSMCQETTTCTVAGFRSDMDNGQNPLFGPVETAVDFRSGRGSGLTSGNRCGSHSGRSNVPLNLITILSTVVALAAVPTAVCPVFCKMVFHQLGSLCIYCNVLRLFFKS